MMPIRPEETVMPGRKSVATLTLAALLPMLIAAAPALGADMTYPDFESQWRNPTAGRGGNPWDTTKPMGLRQQAPLTPEYQAKFEASVEGQAKGGQGSSPGSTCLLAGMPKMMNFAEPMEIIIRPKITYFVPMQVPTRRIYTDGRGWPTDEPPSLGGYSIGRWIDEDGDGRYDVLEVETRNFTGPRVFESTGLPLHADNQTIVKERIYLDKNNNDVLHDEITTIDHALTRPWTVDRTYLRAREPHWLEKNCHESNPHLTIGKEEYFLSADGKLMPVRKGQPQPDLQYFKQSQK
jgi:hypothetical protein